MNARLEADNRLCSSFARNADAVSKTAVRKSRHCNFFQVEAELFSAEGGHPIRHRKRQLVQRTDDRIHNRNRHRYNALYQPNDALNDRLDYRQQSVDHIDDELDCVYQGCTN